MKWLDICTTHHKHCTVPAEFGVPELPSRVLDVWSSFDKIRLCNTPDKGFPYVCLSHCWGNDKPACMTTTESLESNRRGIPLDSLPKTFRDAVDIVRRLGIQYLWIDTMCIIQDNENDWKAESVKMASVYQNAFLTIAASSSSSTHGGCYSSSPPQRKYEIEINDPKVTATSLYARRDLFHIRHSGDHNLDIPELPLLQRGWAYQERLLSSRVLHFSHGEIIWNCVEGIACECGRYQRIGSGEFCNMSAKAYHKRGSSIYKTAGERWQQMVEGYSGLALTRESDKMVALHGLVKQMRPLRRGPYVAGLWADQFHRDLAWHCKRPGRHRRNGEPLPGLGCQLTG
jgi:hypothetical protein